jgi:hypothetical protein
MSGAVKKIRSPTRNSAKKLAVTYDTVQLNGLSAKIRHGASEEDDSPFKQMILDQRLE